jgi:hypothetical protein
MLSKVMGEDESGRCEPLFCSLPIRALALENQRLSSWGFVPIRGVPK